MENNNVVHSSFWSNFFKSPTEKVDLQKSLLSIPIFSRLSKKELGTLINIIHNRNYVSNEYIFYQGDPGLGLYIIRDGEVRVQRKIDENQTISLAVFTKGDFFGELALIDGEKRPASAICETDTRLAVIFKPDLDEFIENYPKSGIKILRGISEIIATRLRKLNEDNYNLQNKLNLKMETSYGT
ncbi:MAG TPA: cyclic nucleotide-binding domain-containing protein [Ignavibacteriaceae bacterium]|nr:cyclic nucleotide-binding domain-containing protein [Ignavibacteriaceae bacterium]